MDETPTPLEKVQRDLWDAFQVNSTSAGDYGALLDAVYKAHQDITEILEDEEDTREAQQALDDIESGKEHLVPRPRTRNERPGTK